MTMHTAELVLCKEDGKDVVRVQPTATGSTVNTDESLFHQT